VVIGITTRCKALKMRKKDEKREGVRVYKCGGIVMCGREKNGVVLSCVAEKKMVVSGQ
jgi:hypothetical protein